MTCDMSLQHSQLMFFFLLQELSGLKKRGVQMLLFGAVLAVHGVALANYYFNRDTLARILAPRQQTI